MSSISVSQDFETFCNNLRMSDATVKAVQSRYHAITRRINIDYWNSESDSQHSLYVGSYGRGTAIYTSDVDIVVELPWTQYSRFNNYIGNGQSALIQDVKNSLQKTYPFSDISGDGQVVVIDFSDGVKFEIVPAFRFDDGSYYYPDSNYGGTWKSMNPKLEIDTFNAWNNLSNKNLKKLCRMARAWNYNMSVLMSGILIDTIACYFMATYEYACKSYVYFDWLSRDFFKYVSENSVQSYWVKFGSGENIKKKYSFYSESKKAYELSNEALYAYSNDYIYTWHEKWREIYGTRFPL